MTLALWTEYKSTALLQSIIQTTPPVLVDAGSLWLRRNGAAGTNHSVVRVPGSSLDRAYTIGRMRHLFRLTSYSTSTQSWMGCGCMMSQEDLTGGAGSAYGVVLVITTGTGQVSEMHLVKFTAGYKQRTDGTVTTIASETGLTIPINTTIAVELRWRLDIPQLGGVGFSVYRGTLSDFSDLTLKLTTNHVSSPLTTSVNEWVGAYIHSSATFECYIDQTRHTRRA